MPATVLKAAGLAELSGAYVSIYGRNAGVSFDIVEPHPLHFDWWVCMPEVQPSSRATHRSEGPCGDDIHFLGSLDFTPFSHDLHHFLRCHDHRIAAPDSVVYLAHRLVHFGFSQSNTPYFRNQ
ncbi:hypothetical protein ES703_65139 [subsurface metagenome]